MTKKDYVAIAEAIVDAHTGRSTEGVPELDGELLINSLCDIFKADNPAFNAGRFEDACGIARTRRVKA